MRERDIHIDNIVETIERDAQGRFSLTPPQVTYALDNVAHLLLAGAPQDVTPEGVEARKQAARIETGKVIRFRDGKDYVVYEIVDCDDVRVLLKRLTKTEARRRAR